MFGVVAKLYATGVIGKKIRQIVLAQRLFIPSLVAVAFKLFIL